MRYKYSLLGKQNYKLDNNLIIHIPTVGEIRRIDNDFNYEIEYFNLTKLFTSTPCDLMVELDDIGVDYTKVSEYELFLMLFSSILSNRKCPKAWDLIFENLDFYNINPKFATIDNNLCVCNNKGNVIFNEEIYRKLSNLIREIINADKNMENYNVPVAATRKYIIERQRLKNKRKLQNQKNIHESELDSIILYLVNDNNFKYNFNTVNEISIYDLYMSFTQICKNAEISGLTTGIYSGNVDISKLDKKLLNRLIL